MRRQGASAPSVLHGFVLPARPLFFWCRMRRLFPFCLTYLLSFRLFTSLLLRSRFSRWKRKRLRDDAKQCKIVLLRYAKALDNIIVIKCN